MKISFLDDPTMSAMGQYMSRLSKRQQIVASNIANIDTPGYKTKDMSFHASLQELLAPGAVPLKTSRPEHIAMDELVFSPMEPEVFEVEGLPVRADHNNVDIDKEMLKLGETSFGYSIMTQLLRSKFRTISTSINEGRSGQ
jgi:flagellar basal-body rod protein FlgB